MEKYRTEKDTLGEVNVPYAAYWGAQTQRSIENFPIGEEKMPFEVIRALALIKLSAAKVNNSLFPTRLTDKKLLAIKNVVSEILNDNLNENFPLSVWQTGSGTQTNMNVNEVIANRGNSVIGEKILHPNDDVNMSQSSNDTFPSAMHISAVLECEKRLIPAVRAIIETFKRLEKDNEGVVKSGRTHLEDAIPISFSQEISGWRSSLEIDLDMVVASIKPLRYLAMGGTAVGTGLNAPLNFDTLVCDELTNLTCTLFYPADNKFHALSSKSELVYAHGALKALASDLMKIANDIRWLASGPRCGIGEIFIPENEPGSSIMPGKVNPTQCEALTMVAVQVIANDTAISLGSSQGNFELNVFMPVIIYNYLQSVRLLSDSIMSFNQRCVSGIVANKEKMRENLHNSLMTATALSPILGYEKTAEIVHKAYEEDISLRAATTDLGYLNEDEFDKVFNPEQMI